MPNLQETIAQLESLSEKDRTRLVESALKARGGLKWIPNPGPQTDAYYSKADCLLYGGEPGGGKSQLLLGLAFNCHKRTLVMRREYGDLDRLVEDALKIHGSRDGFNGSPPPKLRISDSQIIDFGAAHRMGDEQGQMGKGRDLLAVDEATHFAESQIRFLMGWNRTEDPSQRVRTVLATNPPLRPEGLWVIKMFAPWLDPTHPNPARHGELRWVVSNDDGKDEWVSGPDDARVNAKGKVIRPTSRTYIPAKVSDNPYYAASDYERQLDAMPEPYRSLLMGGFTTAFKDKDAQVIPTAWVLEAQRRWTPKPPPGIPMCAIGVDPSMGGDDDCVLACRYDYWYAPLIKYPGKKIKDGNEISGYVVQARRGNAKVIIDMGGGYGGVPYVRLRENIGTDAVVGFKGAESSVRRAKDNLLGFVNKRSQVYWQFMEALDPSQEGGSPIALPPDQELVADLTAPCFEITARGIKITPKEDLVQALGRSTNCGDAIVMSWFEGAKNKTHAAQWGAEQRSRATYINRGPAVNYGPRRKYGMRR